MLQSLGHTSVDRDSRREHSDLWIEYCSASQNSGEDEKGFVLCPTGSISMGADDDLGEMRTARTSNRGWNCFETINVTENHETSGAADFMVLAIFWPPSCF